MSSDQDQTSEELLRRVDDAGLQGELDERGFIGGRLTEGWATRVVSRVRGRYSDEVVFHTSGDDVRGIEARAGADVLVLARTRFAVAGSMGPVILSDRRLPVAIDDPAEWVSWAVDAVETTEQQGLGRPALPDEAFWELIAVLGGEIGEESAERLSLLLADLPGDVPQDFMDALDLKLFALDAPGNTVGFVSDPDGIDDDASLMYRCEIIARGRAAFDEHVRSPRRGTPGVDGLSTPEILYVYEDATGKPLPVRKRPISTGTNPDLWPDAEPIAASRMRVDETPVPGPFSARVQIETLFGGARSGVLHGFAAFVTGPSHVREILGCVIAHTPDGARSHSAVAVEPRIAPDETLQVVLVTSQENDVARGEPLVTLRRPSRLSMRDFVSRFYLGERVT